MIKNIYDFTNLNKFDFSWRLSKDGEELASGEIPTLDIASYESKTIKLDLPKLKDAKAEYYLNIYAKTKVKNGLVPQDHVIAYEQFQLSDFTPETFSKNDSGGGLEITSNDNLVIIKGKDFEVKFDAEKGSITSIDYGNGNLLLKGIETNFWRATIDNDFGYNMPKRLKAWNDATNNQNLLKIAVESGENNRTIEELKMAQSPFKIENENVSVTATYDLPDINGKVTITYDVNDKGEIKVTTGLTDISKDLPVIPRFGNNFIIKNEYQKVNWYGRGPHENYQDRKTSAMVGKYDSNVEDLYFPYIRPQENGNRADVRWVTFTNEAGTGIGIYAPQLFEFSAHHQYNSDFDPGETKQQRHTVDIEKRELVNINIDYKQMGVGGDNSWGFMALDKYQIQPGNLSYSYVIKPLK